MPDHVDPDSPPVGLPQRARVLLDSSPIAAQIHSLKGEFLFANRRVYEMTGVPFGAPLPQGAAIYAEPDRFRQLVKKFTTEGAVRDEEVQYKLPDGSTIWCLVNWQNIEYNGQHALVVWSYEITTQKNVEAAIENAKDMAEQASRTKAEFLANMSHELRTPLNAIIGYSQILQEDLEDLGQTSALTDLKRIESAGKHLLRLINDVLDLSKIDAGKMDLYIESVSIPRLIEEVQSLTGPLAKKRSNKLEFHVPGELPVLQVDFTKLKQCLLNLVSNACKFTEQGAIRVAVEAAGEYIRFEVADTGIGMTEAQTERLFQAFTQADASTTRQFGGTGLGLAITRRFCQMMGGDVSVRSVPGEGSVFTIVLPVNAADFVAKPKAEPIPARKTNERGTRVLLVDDDPQIHHLIGTMLEREGYRVDHASDGPEALELALTSRPAVILLDVMMPKMDGWTVLGKLKENPIVANIPVVIVSLLDDRPLGMSLGAADVLSKPVDRTQLVNVVRTYAGKGAVRILVVDDNADDRDAICKSLRDHDYDVIEARDGPEAVAWLDSHPAPAVILLDLVMPGMDGFAVLERIRSHPGLGQSKVIIQSAKDLSLAETQILRERGAVIVPKGDNARTALLEALEALSL